MSFVVVGSWLLLFQENAHGLRDRLGGRSFKPRVLSFFFFFDRMMGLERWPPPRAFVLGVARSALLSASSIFLVFAYRPSFLGGVRLLVLVLWSAMCVFFFLVFSCSCLMLVLMSWGGFSGVGGYVCCGVCVFSSASPCFKESPRGAPLCMPCLLLLLVVPSSCLLSMWFPLCCFYLFLMHVHAQRRRPLGLGFIASCVAALLSQDPRRPGPPDLPCLGPLSSQTWLMHLPQQFPGSSDARKHVPRSRRQP